MENKSVELLSTKMQATIAKNCFTIIRSQHLAQPAAQSLDQRTIPETFFSSGIL